MAAVYRSEGTGPASLPMYDDPPPSRLSRAGVGRVHRYGQGVQRHRQKWRARAYDRRLGRTIHLGLYPTEREAVRAVEAWWAAHQARR